VAASAAEWEAELEAAMARARRDAPEFAAERARIALITKQAEEERTTREGVQKLPYELQRNIFQALPVDNLPNPDWSLDTALHNVRTDKELRVMTFLKRLGVEMGGIELHDLPWLEAVAHANLTGTSPYHEPTAFAAALRQHRHNAYKIMEQRRQSAAAVLIKANIGNPDLVPLPVGAPGESPGDLLGELPGI